MGASRNDEYGFALRHPVIASEIGKVKTGVGCTNISTNSTRFSAAVGNDDFQEGGQVNAIRHALWSSTISSKYGTDIAKEATNSHELNANLSGLSFSNKAEADSRCDLLNNEIGILLGSQNKKSSMKQLTGLVLNIFHSDGLWMSSQDKNGNWLVLRQKMSDSDYIKAITELAKCNENGFRPGD